MYFFSQIAIAAYQNAFEIINVEDKRKHILCAISKEEKSAWLRDLTKIMNDFLEQQQVLQILKSTVSVLIPQPTSHLNGREERGNSPGTERRFSGELNVSIDLIKDFAKLTLLFQGQIAMEAHTHKLAGIYT